MVVEALHSLKMKQLAATTQQEVLNGPETLNASQDTIKRNNYLMVFFLVSFFHSFESSGITAIQKLE